MRARLCLVPVVLAVLVASACSVPVVTAEVLPPRTSVTCSAPGVDDPALGRGLLDAKATVAVHGGYLADLRLTLSGADATIDGVDIVLKREGDSDVSLEDVPTGDVVLVGEGNDIRKAVVENVELVARAQAKEWAGTTAVTAVEFSTVTVEITPRVTTEGVTAETSTFALDVCNGCLVEEPSEDECANGSRLNTSVCRLGQDVDSYSCAAAAAAVAP